MNHFTSSFLKVLSLTPISLKDIDYSSIDPEMDFIDPSDAEMTLMDLVVYGKDGIDYEDVESWKIDEDKLFNHLQIMSKFEKGAMNKAWWDLMNNIQDFLIDLPSAETPLVKEIIEDCDE